MKTIRSFLITSLKYYLLKKAIEYVIAAVTKSRPVAVAGKPKRGK